MSQVVIFLIRAYQIILSPLVHTAVGFGAGCRYSVSCSEYAIISLRKRGVINGGIKSIKRLASCHQ